MLDVHRAIRKDTHADMQRIPAGDVATHADMQRIPAGAVPWYRQRRANGCLGSRSLGLNKIRAKRILRLRDFGVKAS